MTSVKLKLTRDADFLLNSICDKEFPYLKQSVSITGYDEKRPDGEIFQTKLECT